MYSLERSYLSTLSAALNSPYTFVDIDLGIYDVKIIDSFNFLVRIESVSPYSLIFYHFDYDFFGKEEGKYIIIFYSDCRENGLGYDIDDIDDNAYVYGPLTDFFK